MCGVNTGLKPRAVCKQLPTTRSAFAASERSRSFELAWRLRRDPGCASRSWATAPPPKTRAGRMIRIAALRSFEVMRRSRRGVTRSRGSLHDTLQQRRGEPISLDDPESREAAANVAAAPPGATDVWSLLHALPIQYRQVLTLFYAEERSYEEIARALDLPLGTVKTHIHRGRKMLAQLYAEGGTK